MNEDINEKEFGFLDAFIEQMKNLPRNTLFVEDPFRVEELLQSARRLNSLLVKAGCRFSITCEQSKASPTLGVITIEGLTLEVLDTEAFAEAVSQASTVEVYPLTSGNIKLELGFYGVAVAAGSAGQLK